jgi:hypothetical protein
VSRENISNDQVAFFYRQIIFDSCISDCQVETALHKNIKPLSVDTDAFFFCPSPLVCRQSGTIEKYVVRLHIGSAFKLF